MCIYTCIAIIAIIASILDRWADGRTSDRRADRQADVLTASPPTSVCFGSASGQDLVSKGCEIGRCKETLQKLSPWKISVEKILVEKIAVERNGGFSHGSLLRGVVPRFDRRSDS